jgi:hypothetical protein
MDAMDVISILISRYSGAFPNIALLAVAAAVIIVCTACTLTEIPLGFFS